jgi:ABC-type glycerol-3-phosphate transport system substrate-binding protein
MFQNRKFKLVIFLVLTASMILSACQPAATPAPTVPAAPAVEEPAAPAAPAAEEPAAPAAEEPAPAPAADKPSGNLTIMIQQANQDVFEQTGLLDAFAAEYPDVTIEWINHPPAEVANQVALAIQGGTGAPDLGVTETRSISRLVDLGGLVDLTAQMQPYLIRSTSPCLNWLAQMASIMASPGILAR